MYTINALTGDDVHFDDNTAAEYAVAYAYCEENNLMSALFSHCRAGTLPAFYKTLPMMYGRRSVACGDWLVPSPDSFSQ